MVHWEELLYGILSLRDLKHLTSHYIQLVLHAVITSNSTNYEPAKVTSVHEKCGQLKELHSRYFYLSLYFPWNTTSIRFNN